MIIVHVPRNSTPINLGFPGNVVNTLKEGKAFGGGVLESALPKSSSGIACLLGVP